LLRIELRPVQLQWVLDGLLHGLAGDLVEQDATHLDGAPDLFGDVPGNRLALAVRVGC
jgi:hypothetical protein